MRCGVVLAGCLAAATAAPLAAQSSAPTVSDTADRPGFADSARVLGRGHVQLETGVLVGHDGGDGDSATTVTLPQAQLRAGLASRLDVSLWWDGLVRMSTTGLAAVEMASADPRIGVKIQLLHHDTLDLALVASAGVPVGSRSLSSGDSDPQARLEWGAAISRTLGLSGTLDVAEDRRDGTWRPRPAVSAALTRSLGTHIGVFAGLTLVDGDRGSRPDTWSAEGGLTESIGDRRQLDVWGGRRLSGAGSSWFVGGGFVQRIR
jgi:hypothetical protein